MREVRRFQARGDSGAIYTVVEWAEQTPFKPLNGPPQMLDGARVLQLLDGSHVNQKDAVTFEIFDTEEVIRKIVD